MKRRSYIFALTLLLICMLPIAFNVSLVRADVGGTGKFLTIAIVDEGYVTATKVQSGETWNFYPADPPQTEKVGAGTVSLFAKASEGWEFSHWGGDLTGTTNPREYRTEKYGYVVAVFVEKTFTITASAVGNGAINPSGAVPVKYGASQTFGFVPGDGHHISAILVDGAYLSSYAESYTFEDVTADHTIEVSFSLDGEAFVPSGSDVTAFLASGAWMGFDYTEGGKATGEDQSFDFTVGGLKVGAFTAWNIQITFTYTGEVLITLHYDDTGIDPEVEEPYLRLIRGDSVEAIRSDVNNDLVVDGTDVSIVANAVKQPYWYDPVLDINKDGYVNEADVHVVNENKGTLLVDITVGIDTDLNIIWGSTGHLSIFGVH